MVESDWEGPWVLADHAYEVTRKGIPDGDKLFAGISEYDDYLSYVQRKENYEPGDTLTLIAPFLIAFGVNDSFLVRVAQENARFIKGAFEALKTLVRLGHSPRVISTSYCQYVRYTTSLAGIPERNIRCTLFPIDEYSEGIVEKDKKLVREKAKDVTALPRLGISASTRMSDLSSEALRSIRDLDDFFWKELPDTSFEPLLVNLKPLGGYRKLDAAKDLLQDENKQLSDAVVIGDSITDWAMLHETRKAGGLAVSFNGNDYAVRNACLAILSDNCMVTPMIVDLFESSGIEVLQEIAENWSLKAVKDAFRKGQMSSVAYREFMKFKESEQFLEFPEVTWITNENVDATIKRSKAIRKTIRGIDVGSLG